MYNKYFVLITNEIFGIFSISAECYPTEFLDNISQVDVINSNEVDRYLIERIGTNILINKKFNLYNSVGKIYSREPNQ